MQHNIQILPVSETQSIELPESLGFGKIFTDRMFKQYYRADAGWHNASISAYEPLTLDPATTVYHNGQMIFDGTKAYRRADGNINLFRPEQNAARFNHSAERMGMPATDAAAHVAAIEQLVQLEHRWVPDRPGTALYIRPVMIGIEKTLEVRASREYLHYIILTPVAPYFADGFAPVSVYVADDYVRAVRGGTGEAKTPGNYASSIAATEVAMQQGYQQVLWLDGVERKYVDEVGAMNIAFVTADNTILTPRLTGAILQGVTRNSLLQLAPDLGFPVSEEQLPISDVISGIKDGSITEVFGMGTGAVIAPVNRLSYQGTEYTLGDGQPGPIASRLYTALTDIQYGRSSDPYGWTRQIEVASAAAKSA